MKKFLVLAASLLLAATPAAAQQSVSDAAPTVAAPVVTAAPAVEAQLFPTRDEVRQRVAAAEARRAHAPMGSSDWWYTVAAVALGVIIALLLLD
ncbi:MAG TPA: hypothetical protein VF665_24400 [Longimicrobium sp.]|jgi:hypothetical protein|uniref:hypothetical protein n=1 Tax=Longimicrobium sp. TaxID=2029185 RepID=UPI002ED7EF35